MEGQLSVSVRSKWKSMLHHIVRSAGSKVDCDSNSFPSFSSHVVVSDRRFMHLFQQPSCRPFKLSRFLQENWCLISGDCTASSKASFMLVRTGMPRQNHSLTARRQDKARKARHFFFFKNPKSFYFCWKKGKKNRRYIQCRVLLHYTFVCVSKMEFGFEQVLFLDDCVRITRLDIAIERRQTMPL